MTSNENNELVPVQLKGGQSNTEHYVTARSREEALYIFKRAYKRLLNINIWHKLSGKGSAGICSKNGKYNLRPGKERWQRRTAREVCDP